MNNKHAAYLFLLSVSLSAPKTNQQVAAKQAQAQAKTFTSISPIMEEADQHDSQSMSGLSRRSSISTEWGSPRGSYSSSFTRHMMESPSSSSSAWPGSPTSSMSSRRETPSPFEGLVYEETLGFLVIPESAGFLKIEMNEDEGTLAPHSTPVKNPTQEQNACMDEDSDFDEEELVKLTCRQELSFADIIEKYQSVDHINMTLQNISKELPSLNNELSQLHSILSDELNPHLDIRDWVKIIFAHKKLINEEGLTQSHGYYRQGAAYKAIATAYLIRQLLDLKVRLTNYQRQQSRMSW